MKKFESGKFKDHNKFNEWFSHCSSEQIPYIIIINRNKYSEIKWDYINLDKGLDNAFVDNEKEHRKQLEEVFRKYASEKSSYEMTNFTFTAEKIPLENAEYLAAELFDALLERIGGK